MEPLIDDLDKNIMRQLCKGISSYEELARNCGVTRNTIYRRIAFLEKHGFIDRITRVGLNYDRLGLSAIGFGVYVEQSNLKQMVDLLKSDERVNLLWRSYGNHNVIFLSFCDKGKEGELISEVEAMLANFGVSCVDVSVGYVWDKMDFCNLWQ